MLVAVIIVVVVAVVVAVVRVWPPTTNQEGIVVDGCPWPLATAFVCC